MVSCCGKSKFHYIYLKGRGMPCIYCMVEEEGASLYVCVVRRRRRRAGEMHCMYVLGAGGLHCMYLEKGIALYE